MSDWVNDQSAAQWEMDLMVRLARKVGKYLAVNVEWHMHHVGRHNSGGTSSCFRKGNRID